MIVGTTASKSPRIVQYHTDIISAEQILHGIQFDRLHNPR